MEIQISKVEKQNDGSQIYEAFNKWGDTNTLNFPLVAEPLNNESPQPMFEVVDCRLQGFVGPEGFVTSHEEDPGVIEMYFILSGKVEATRDGEVYELFGRFNNLKQIKSIGELVLDDDLTSPNLRIENKKGKRTEIPGFIIPPGVEHSTRLLLIEGSVARFVAIKIRRLVSVSNEGE